MYNVENMTKDERNKLIEKILHNPLPTKTNYFACGLVILISISLVLFSIFLLFMAFTTN
jgi:hypothetical protein